MPTGKLSVLKPIHATWSVEMYYFFTSAQGRVHVLKGWEKAGIKGVVTEKYYHLLIHIKTFTQMTRDTCIYVSKLHYVTEQQHFFFRVCGKEFSM